MIYLLPSSSLACYSLSHLFSSLLFHSLLPSSLSSPCSNFSPRIFPFLPFCLSSFRSSLCFPRAPRLYSLSFFVSSLPRLSPLFRPRPFLFLSFPSFLPHTSSFSSLFYVMSRCLACLFFLRLPSHLLSSFLLLSILLTRPTLVFLCPTFTTLGNVRPRPTHEPFRGPCFRPPASSCYIKVARLTRARTDGWWYMSGRWHVDAIIL